MKKAILILSILMLLASPAMAAWTNTAEIVSTDKDVTLVKVTMVSDGATNSFNLFTTSILASTYHKDVDGGYIWVLTTDPDGTAAPDNTYTVTLTNYVGGTCTLTDRSTSATEDELGSDVSSTGHFLKIYRSTLTIAVTDIGTAGDTIVLYLEVSRP